MKNIVLGHKRKRDSLLGQSFVLRDGVEQVSKNLKNNLIKVVMGPRRANLIICLHLRPENGDSYIPEFAISAIIIDIAEERLDGE